MYSEEKKKLEQYKQSFDDIDIPDELDDQIHQGFLKANQGQKRRLPFKWLLSVALVAIVLVGFASTKYILDFVRDNKGLVDAIQHDYYMEIDESEKVDGVEFTVDGVIADEYGMVVLYTIESDEKHKDLRLNDARIDHEVSSYSFGNEEERNKGKAVSGMIEIYYQSPVKGNEYEFEAEVRGGSPEGKTHQSVDEQFTVSFVLPDDFLTEKTYELNETVSIEEQKMTFTKAVITPLRTEVHVEMDPSNTKKILNFDDLRLVDEAGEEWGKIVNGITATHASENEQVIYLQSNYFTEPEELYLSLDQVQAIDKDEQFVIVDPVKEEILQQPEGDELTDMEIDLSYLVFYTKGETFSENYPISLGTVYNQDGDVLESYSSYVRGNEIGISLFDLSEESEPVSVEITGYPTWITGDEKIRIK